MKIFDAFDIKQQILFAVLLPVVGFSVFTYGLNSSAGVVLTGPLVFLLASLAVGVTILFSLLSTMDSGGDEDGVRQQEALKVADTNIMIADKDSNIVYMNESVEQMFADNQAELGRELPRFNMQALIGSNMDIFHKNPAHQRGMVDGLREIFKGQIAIGPLTFGLLATPIFDKNNNRSGTVVEWSDLTEKLAIRKEQARLNAENQRVKQALDSVKTNAMIADADNNIVYMNESVTDMMRDAEADIKQDLPNFDANNLMQQNIDVFHKDPSHQQAMLESLKGTYESSIVVGGRTFELIANPIIDEDDNRIGTVVEWSDMTVELARREEEATRNAETQRVKQALDSVKTNAMIADADNNIVYMNESVSDMMKNAEADIKQDLPNFDANDLMHQSIDVFHKDPSHQQAMLETLKGTYESSIVVGGRTFELIANPIIDEDENRIGTVVEWSDMTVELARRAEEARLNAENERVKQALDSVKTNAMIADADNTIVYMNEAVLGMMRKAESDIKQDLPNFNANDLMQKNIDIFHKNPAHQQAMLASLKDTFESSIIVGGRTFDLIANPIIDDDDNRVGTVVEWNDKTEELAVEVEIDQLVNAAVDGDLSQRLTIEGKQGFTLNLSQGLNKLMGICSEVITDVYEVMTEVSQGSLTRKIEREYEGEFDALKSTINDTVDKLTEIISGIRESAITVSGGAQEISQGNTDLSQRTEEQASSLEETASSMEEMTSTVKQSAENAVEANTLASNAKDKAQRGGEVVRHAVAAMEAISDSSKEIADIIGVIDEIAFQTNLLALNAAVEAARAGEQGRGFAVVAGEVRSLAGRSADAAKDIKELIRDSETKVSEGAQLVNESGKTLDDIVDAVDKVSTMVNGISEATAEQNNGIAQVNIAVGQMDEMTQQNAALVEQATAASEAMAEQAQGMSQMVSFFNLPGNAAAVAAGGGGGGGSSAPIVSHKPAASGGGAGSDVSFTSSGDEWEEF